MAHQLDPNFIEITVKVGNKNIAPSKAKHLGMKDGMIVDYNDPLEWKDKVVHSDNMERVYAIIKVPRSWKASIIDALKPIETVGSERERTGYIDLAALETLTGISSLESNLRGPGIVPVIDGSLFSTNLIKSSSAKVWGDIKDLNLVTAGNFSVKSGGDYTNWVSAVADLGNLTSDLTFTHGGTTTDTAIGIITESLNGNRLRMTSDSPHKGDPNTGHIANINHAGVGFGFEQEGPGTAELDRVYFKRITTSSLASIIKLLSTGTEYTLLAHDLLFDLNAGIGRFAFHTADPTPLCHFYNWLIWDADRQSMIFDLNDGNASSIYENLTILNSGREAVQHNSNGGTFRNIYAQSNGGYSAFGNNGGATGRNCASDDTSADNANWNTGSGNIVSIATSQFESASDASSEFAKVIEGTLSTAGITTAIAGNIKGIRNNSGGRVGATPSIGADEFPAIAGGSLHPTLHVGVGLF